MNIYRVILLIFIILFIFEERLKKNKKIYKLLKNLSILILVLLCTFKGSVARDTEMYRGYFEKIPNIFEIDLLLVFPFEYGYILLNMLIKTITTNSNYLFMSVALISLFNLKKFIEYFSKNYFYSLSFYYARYFFLKEFTQIRNGLAYSFILLALIKLYEKKKEYFIIYILIAGSFHKSAYFALTFLIIEKILNKKKIKKLILIIIPILPFLGIKNLIVKIIKFLVGGKPIYLDAYLTGVFSKPHAGYSAIIFAIILLYLLLIFYKKILLNKKVCFIFNTYLYSVLISSVFWGFGDIQGRLASFFNTEFVLVDKVPKLFKNKIIIKTLMIIYVILIYYVCFTRRLNLEKEYLPYFR